jgi:peptide subunit release factor 1 (eRF1)
MSSRICKRDLDNFFLLSDTVSMLTIFIPPNDNVTRIHNLLLKELEVTHNIKCKLTRDRTTRAVCNALNCTDKLKTQSTPENGIIIYSGVSVNGPRMVAFEPKKTVNTSLYLMSDKFILPDGFSETDFINGFHEMGLVDE